MKLENISITFNSEELEALHYALEMGVRHYKKNKCSIADKWIDKAEEIRKKLPINLRFYI